MSIHVASSAATTGMNRVYLVSAQVTTRMYWLRPDLGSGPLWSTWMKYVAGLDEPIPGTLRHVDIGGSVADPGLVRRWLEMTGSKVKLMNRYGPTETTVTVTAQWMGLCSSTCFTILWTRRTHNSTTSLHCWNNCTV